ncbi:MAG: VanW family protein [Desulfitobacteriaceae bacterium]
MRLTKKSAFQVILMLTLMTLTGYLAGCAGTSTLNADTPLPAGTKVDDTDLSGLSLKEGRQKLTQYAEDKLEQSLFLVYNDKRVSVTWKELGVGLDADQTLNRVASMPGQVSASILKIDPLKASNALDEKLSFLKRPAQDASYTIKDDKFVIKPAVSGLSVNVDQIIHEAKEYSLASLPPQIEVSLAEVPAAVTTEGMKELAFDGVIGDFSTKFAVQEENRTANLTAAAKALDRKIIKPGETFSFNQTVGPRTPETGYKDAYVIINNEYVQGTGGGICQVSSTLYNTVLLANQTIVERVPHAVAVTYVHPGLDATVNYPNLDFKFKNDTTGILYLRTEVRPGILTIRLWGKKNDKTITFQHEVEKEIDFQTEQRPDPRLPVGKVVQEQTGSKGYIVKTWRIMKDSQGNEARQLLSRDEYKPANRILRVGVKE